MKKRIRLIVLCIILIVAAIGAVQTYRILKRIDLGKQFPLYIEEGEVIDFNDVNEERIIDGQRQHWFDHLRDKERIKLADYMEKTIIKSRPDYMRFTTVRNWKI